MTDKPLQNSRKCIILLSFIEAWTPSFIREEALSCDYLICADGGEAIAKESGLTPDCVIGDFDSDPLTDRFDCLYITYPAEKDLTDCEAAILHAVSLGYRDIKLLGGINGRLDHTIGNIAMLFRFYDETDHLEFFDMRNSMFLLKNSGTVIRPSSRYKYFSIASIDPFAEGVDITGAKYELSNAIVPRDTSLGISNEVTSSKATVSVKNGTLLIIRSADAK